MQKSARLREEHRQQVQRVADGPDPDVDAKPTHGGRREGGPKAAMIAITAMVPSGWPSHQSPDWNHAVNSTSSW